VLIKLTSKLVIRFVLQSKVIKAVKSSIPVKSEMAFEDTSKDVSSLISAVSTWPSIVASVTIPKSIKACSKLTSGIAVVFNWLAAQPLASTVSPVGVLMRQNRSQKHKAKDCYWYWV